MRVADVSGAGDNGQIGRDAGARVGLGLLSRFIGAVFLVLLGGLLLLDRALQRASHNQAELDSQSAALLTESFMASHAILLERVVDLAGTPRPAKDSVLLRVQMQRLLAASAGARAIWVIDPAGRRLAVSSAALPSSAMLDSLERLRPPPRALTVVTRGPASSSWIVLVRAVARPAGETRGTAGVLITGDSLKALLERTRPDTRLALAVLAGSAVTSIGLRRIWRALPAT